VTQKIWKKKEWLLANGHIDKIGRGRLSRTCHDALKAAVASGVKFSDYETTVDKADGTVVKAPVAVSYDMPTVRWNTVLLPNGKPSGATVKAACFNCSVSLAYCTCDLRGLTPRAIISNDSGYVPVRLEMK
jgi:hypothetical protein